MKPKWYTGKQVVLTLSRTSGQTVRDTLLQTVLAKHNLRYIDVANHLEQKFMCSLENICHGQRYYKLGALNTTIKFSSNSPKGFLSFMAICENINNVFLHADSIFISLRVTTDLTNSPCYLEQFLRSIHKRLISKVYIIYFNRLDEGKLQDNWRIVIPAEDLLLLCSHTNVLPVDYLNQNDLMSLPDIPPSWLSFHSMFRSSLQREDIPRQGRNM